MEANAGSMKLTLDLFNDDPQRVRKALNQFFELVASCKWKRRNLNLPVGSIDFDVKLQLNVNYDPEKLGSRSEILSQIVDLESMVNKGTQELKSWNESGVLTLLGLLKDKIKGLFGSAPDSSDNKLRLEFNDGMNHESIVVKSNKKEIFIKAVERRNRTETKERPIRKNKKPSKTVTKPITIEPIVLTETERVFDFSNIDLSNYDPLIKQATALVVKHKQGSASLIQSKFKIGYNRAGRLIDQLHELGIVGPYDGSKARQVLVKALKSTKETEASSPIEFIPEGENSDKYPSSDIFLKKAADYVIQEGHASISMFQRKLGVGYQRSMRLIYKLEKAGIIDGDAGAKIRKPLVSELPLIFEWTK